MIDARLWEGDVQNAYTTADIVRDVLIYYPDGKHPNSPTRSCLRLLKALYGVADSGKAFYDEWIAFHYKHRLPSYVLRPMLPRTVHQRERVDTFCVPRR